jgi:MtfA peptidase
MIFRWLTERRRARLLETPFPDEWRGYLTANVKAYRLLDEDEQQRLRDLVQVFVAEKHWEGCGGLELDDEMRVTIAGSACLMILGREHDLMREVESILVYPSGVMAPEHQAGFFDGSARVIDGPTAVLGLAHHGGPVVLAWDSVLQGARNDRDGQNLVIHEMAHKIDFIDGEADGTPPLDSAAERSRWARVCSEAFLARKSGEETFLRAYAGTNEAEFFAVVSEVFFEKPKQLRHDLPELYDLLVSFYRLDLAAR